MVDRRCAAPTTLAHLDDSAACRGRETAGHCERIPVCRKRSCRARDLQIFSLTLSQLSYRGSAGLLPEHTNNRKSHPLPATPTDNGREALRSTGPLGMGLHPSLELLVQPASGLRPTKPGRDDLDTINEVRRRY